MHGCVFLMINREITGIELQKRNKNRVNIHLDGQFEFGLTRILAAGLHPGMQLTEQQIDQLKEKDAKESVYARALNFIAFRPRTTEEVRKKLTGLGIDPETVSATLERLLTNNLLEDKQFAVNWVENRAEFKPRGRKLLKLELRKKGLEQDVIESAMVTIPEEDELALKAATSYARRLQHLEWKAFHDRLAGFLLRRGFDYSTVKGTVATVWQNIKINREGK